MTENEKLDLLLEGMRDMKTDMQVLKTEIQEVKADVQVLKTEIQDMKQRATNIENNVTAIKLDIEDEIRVNIKHVAEGHLDLSRNLHAAMKPNEEVEMLSIRVKTLETDMRNVKAKLA
ncbi:MAG: hypothetical protein K2K54_07760 [Lachnospiraceae bacterium]|nr:hypothetical protein [Lachnospiraceae bacterium]